MQRIGTHNIDPSQDAGAGDHLIVDDDRVVGYPFAGAIVLEHGQTLTHWMTTHGVTAVPDGTIVVELDA